jgi:hypothetical protein
MTIAVWIVSGLLAALNLFAGGTKVLTPEAKLTKQFAWVETTGLRNARVIGGLEVLAAIGLILPRLTGIVPILSAFAATGLVLLQLGAIIVHIRRGEAKVTPMNTVLLLLAGFVAVASFLGF